MLGDYIGFRESPEVEFKEFIIKLDPEAYLETNEIESIVLTGNLCKIKERFNFLILNNIDYYFKFYIPKYFSVFGNSQLDKAELYIGVNDFGEISGIPYFGNLTVEYIATLLDSTKPFLNCDTDIDELLKLLKIEVILLETDIDNLENSIEKLISEYHAKKIKYAQEYCDFVIRKKNWKKQIDHYLKKIIDYANTPCYRKEVAQFIKENSDKHNFVIDLLNSDTPIEVGDGTEIGIRKIDKNDVIYWITEYKDKKINEIKKLRPDNIQYITFSNSIYTTYFTLLSNLRYKFVENNKDIKYYMIKISFPTNFAKSIFYKNLENHKWQLRTRILVNGHPCCV